LRIHSVPAPSSTMIESSFSFSTTMIELTGILFMTILSNLSRALHILTK
jgi:hypothetical protein